MKGLIKSLFKGKTADELLTYEEARGLARDEALDVRRDLAARSDVEPEILYFLAEDTAPEVRRQIAVNKATPVHADLLLASDDDQDVHQKFSYEERSPFAPDRDVLDLTTAKMPVVEDEPDITAPLAEGVPFAGKACVYCGERLPSGRVVKFCPFCGRDLRMVECPSCGSQLEAGWQYCLTCGDPIGT